MPVLVGSLPLSDHKEAIELILKETPMIPLWPQLPHNPLEHMMPQFAENIPCITEQNIEQPEGRIFFDIEREGFEEDMLAFYEEYIMLSEAPSQLENSRFALSRQRGKGLHLFREAIKNAPDIKAVKGQVTGPFTMLTGIKDKEGKAGYFNDTIRDMVIKGISMKAAWQARVLAQASQKTAIIFIDEPAMAGLGSTAFIGVTGEEIQTMVNEVAEAIHQQGGLVGIHVCANTEWATLLKSQIDIINFDAFSFFDKFIAEKEEINNFLNRGGIIAWGGIPTNKEDIPGKTSEMLQDMFNQQMAALVSPERSMKDIIKQTLITPSCGTGSLPLDLAKQVVRLTRETAQRLQKQHL